MTERVSRPRVKPAPLLPSEVLRSAGGEPLAHMLESGFSEHSVPIYWHRVQTRLHEPSRRRAALPWALAAAGVLLVLGLWGFSDFKSSNASLRLSSGQLPAALVAEATPRNVELSDGSSIRVAQQSRLEVVSNDETVFVTALSRGSATFEVNPKAKRRWVVEVGLTSVEVVGTRFTVTRGDTSVNVAVEQGLVLVRGAAVPGGQQRLGAGQQLNTPTAVEKPISKTGVAGAARFAAFATSDPEADSESPEAASSEDAEAPDQANAHEAEVPEEPRRSRALASPPTSKANHQPAAAEPRVAVKGNSLGKPSNVPPNIEALLEEADRAREAGDVKSALQLFERVIATAPRFDPRRGLAAMSVARITIRRNPARAASALRSTLDSMPKALQENATARLVEAYAKSGQASEAQRIAVRYLERFPKGRRAEDVRRWAAP